jgi:hypothetical protein
MNYEKLTVSYSANISTGELWKRFEPTVSVLPNEDIFEVAAKVEADIKRMLKLPTDYSDIAGHPMSLLSESEVEQKKILISELREAKKIQQIVTIYNEAPNAVKADNEFIREVQAAKAKLGKTA